MIFALNALYCTKSTANVKGDPASPPIHPTGASAQTMSHSRTEPRELRLPDLKNVAISAASLAASSAPSPELMAVAKNTKNWYPNPKVVLYFPHRQKDLEKMSAPVSEEWSDTDGKRITSECWGNITKPPPSWITQINSAGRRLSQA